jgi:glycosyltransferase involved in cell wall biosynthesis
MNSLSKQETLVVIPVYNHALQLRGVVKKAIYYGWQVLVVDDGSTDEGLTQISGLSCEKLSLAKNIGKGVAILRGAQWALEKGYKAIITIDADGQLDPGDAESLFVVAQKNWPAFIIGDRIMSQDTVPKASIFGRKFSNFWVRLETGVELPDTQSGFRLYPVAALIVLPLKSFRYDFEIEALVRASWSGLKIYSVPVSVDYPKKEDRISHFHKFKDNFRLTKLHTKLVVRALLPIPHSKIFTNNESKNNPSTSLYHPIKLIKELCRQHDSTLQLAIAAWLGIFLGALPLIAVHTVVILYVAHKLHLNKIAAVAASQLCAPPVVPVLCIEIGFFLRTGSILTDLNWDTLVLQMHERLWEYFLGALILGPLLGTFIASLTYLIIDRLRKEPEASCDQSGT